MIASDTGASQLLNLSADERIVWTAAPDPVRSYRSAWYLFFLNTAWVVMLALLPLLFGLDDGMAVRRLYDGFLLLYMLVMGFVLSPWSRRRELAATRYYLTTQRFAVIRGHTQRVASHSLALLRRLVRREPLSEQNSNSDTARLYAEFKYVLDPAEYRRFEQQLLAGTP